MYGDRADGVRAAAGERRAWSCARRVRARDGGCSFSGDAADRSGARRRETLNPLGASHGSRIRRWPPPLLADEPATREAAGFETQKEEKGVAGVPRRARTDAVSSSSTSSSPRAQLTARTYVSGGGDSSVEAFSRSRHGRAKELDALFSRGVHGARAVDAFQGLTNDSHIAAQNNQRKTAKLVLKRTDYAVDPPSREILNQQTNAGQTALHYAFAYGYHDLARWLVSLGADDGVVNAHGLSCYEGLDPDEPVGAAPGDARDGAAQASPSRRAEARRPCRSPTSTTARGGTTSSSAMGAEGGPTRSATEGPLGEGVADHVLRGELVNRQRRGPRETHHPAVPAVPGEPPPTARRRPPCGRPSASRRRASWSRVRVPDTARRGFARRDPASFRPRRSRTRPSLTLAGAVEDVVRRDETVHSVHSMHSPYAYGPPSRPPSGGCARVAAAAHGAPAAGPSRRRWCSSWPETPGSSSPGFRGDLFPARGARVPPGGRPRDAEGGRSRGHRGSAGRPRRDPRTTPRFVDTSSDELGRGVRARDRRT